MNRVWWGAVGVAVVLLAAGCANGKGIGTSNDGSLGVTQRHLSTDSYGYEERITEQNQQHLDQVQPPPLLNYSLERQNLINYAKTWNDPTRVSYIYLLTQMGTIMAYYAVKGKVSSVNSMLTDPTQVLDVPANRCFSGSCVLQVPSPQMDGSYGPNGSNGTIFFFTTSGALVQWSGLYLWSTVPLHLSSVPVLTQPVGG